MKKSLLLAVVMIALAYVPAFSQSGSAYEQGSNIANAGIGLGATYWGTGYSSPVSLNVGYERGVTENISVGGKIGYASSSYSWAYGGDSYKVTSRGILIAAKANYHFLTTDVWDPYAGADLGYITTSNSVSSNFGGSGTYGKSGGVGFGIHGGARYFFQPNFGVYGELGYGSFSILELGVTLKF